MRLKHWFYIILIQIGLVALGLFLYHLFLGGSGIDPGDAITIWATVITIVFIVFSVLGIMNIDEKMLEKMIDIKRDIFMYGSDKVFKAFNTWLLSTTSSNDKTQFAAFLDFVLEMRDDLCNNKTKLTKHDILLNLTQSEEEARKLFN